MGPQKPSMDLLRKLGRIWSLPQMGCLEEAGGGELRAATVPAGWLRDQRPALAGTAVSVLRKGHLEAELGVARGPGRWKAVEEGGRRGLLPGDGPRKHTRDPTGEETKAETLAAAGAGDGRPKPGRPALRLPLLSLAAVARRRPEAHLSCKPCPWPAPARTFFLKARAPSRVPGRIRSGGLD